MEIISYGMTHIGQKRKSNQDSIYLNSKDHLYIVADGVGGHNGGDVASAMAVELIPRYLLGQSIHEENIRHHLECAVSYANQAILDHAVKQPELEGMGTTVVGMFFFAGNLYILNVGDSRTYLLHKEELYQLTRDHSLVQEKVNMGIYSREQAAHDPMRNVLLRTVGHEVIAKVDIFSYQAAPDDCLLLCSDGLYNIVSCKEILALLKEHISSGDKCTESHVENAVKALVDLANKNGGSDNISAILTIVK